MDRVCISFGLESASADMMLPDNIETDYKEVYKPAATFLYSHPDCILSFSFTGPQLLFFKKKHPEFLEILQQLSTRKQIEVFGGGFYNPVFPLLYPMDRSGQVDMLSAEIRQSIGKRPRGITVCASSWDPSLVISFQTCGMEYVLLDNSLIPPSKQYYLPIIMSDRGKSIDILPVFRNMKPQKESTPGEYLSCVQKKIAKAVKNDKYASVAEERFVSVMLNHADLKNLLETGWMEKMCGEVRESSDKIRFTTPGQYRKSVEARVPAYITEGLRDDIAQWARVPYTSAFSGDGYPVTIYDFLQTYPQSKALYDRMMYVSMLVNQCHGDKMRKKSAREKLWEAQNGDGFICTAEGTLVNSAYRQRSYRLLSEAEHIVRECEKFEESVTDFDYDGDGYDEYICRMQNYTACIHQTGGAIRELDVTQNSGNYADNLSRISEFDGCSDGYYRGLFVDHVFTNSDFSKYMERNPAGDGVFSRVKFIQQEFSGTRNEIQLFAEDVVSEEKLPVSLRKKYIATSGGFIIQYIFKNESDKKLEAEFAVESNFAQTNFTNKNFNAYKVEIVTAGKKQEIDTKTSACELISSGLLNDVSAVQITDSDNGLSFTFEPNENCGFTFTPITFMRPAYMKEGLVPAGMTFSSAMFWPINLEPGMEMEKTINFSIFNMHHTSAKNSIRKK